MLTFNSILWYMGDVVNVVVGLMGMGLPGWCGIGLDLDRELGNGDGNNVGDGVGVHGETG